MFFTINLLNRSESSEQNFLKFDSSYPGIKEPFCPKWIKGNPADTTNHIFLLSNCGNGDYALYKTRFNSHNFDFEEVILPELTDQELDNLELTNIKLVQFLYVKNTLKAWVIRERQFEYLTDFLAAEYITNPDIKQDAVIREIHIDVYQMLNVYLYSES
jgi:hypothetical protein